MKKKNRFLLAIAIVILGYLNLNFITVQSSNVSNLQLANIEALAKEGGTQTLDCFETVSSKGENLLTHKTYCGTCTAVSCRTWSDESTCETDPPPTN